jgi:hypothetical protein
MTGGVGFIRDASATFDYNRKQIQREEAFGRMKKNPYHGKEDLRKNYPEATETQLKAMREAFLEKKRKEDRIKAAVFIALLLAVTMITLRIFF